ncbi:MAG: hypothetical protein ACC658_09160, partial [Acidimicrobiia bacterium]
MRVLAIGLSNVRRMLRERSNIFFVFIFPIAIVLLIGAQFGGGVDPAVGLFAMDDGQIARSVVSEIEAIDGIDAFSYETEAALFSAVELGNVQAGVFLP